MNSDHLIGAEFAHVAPDFHQGLREAGFVDGQSVAIEFRWAEDQYHRLSALAEELVHRNVTVIVTAGSTLSALAAKAATTHWSLTGTGTPLKVVNSFGAPACC
jgi:putative ABC transport system substrate-binding protein